MKMQKHCCALPNGDEKKPYVKAAISVVDIRPVSPMVSSATEHDLNGSNQPWDNAPELHDIFSD